MFLEKLQQFPLDIFFSLIALSGLTWFISAKFFNRLLSKKYIYIETLQHKIEECEKNKNLQYQSEVEIEPHLVVEVSKDKENLSFEDDNTEAESIAKVNTILASENDSDSIVNNLGAIETSEKSDETFSSVSSDQDDLTIIEGIGPKISQILSSNAIDSYDKLANATVSSLEKILSEAGHRYQMHDPASWPIQAALAASGKIDELNAIKSNLKAGLMVQEEDKSDLSNEQILTDLPLAMESNIGNQVLDSFTSVSLPEFEEKSVPEVVYDKTLDSKANKMAELNQSMIATPKNVEKNDLKLIEGIGIKIQDILNEAGIYSFEQLSTMSPTAIKSLLDSAGPRFQMHDPTSWPEQASLAKDGNWPALKRLQDVLDKGR